MGNTDTFRSTKQIDLHTVYSQNDIFGIILEEWITLVLRSKTPIHKCTNWCEATVAATWISRCAWFYWGTKWQVTPWSWNMKLRVKSLPWLKAILEIPELAVFFSLGGMIIFKIFKSLCCSKYTTWFQTLDLENVPERRSHTSKRLKSSCPDGNLNPWAWI